MTATRLSIISALEDGIDHIRGPEGAPVLLEYGDYECPFSRRAFRAIEQVERLRPDGVRFVFRHFPLVEIHPHALAAAVAAEAAALQGRFWEMHGLLFHHQRALEDRGLHVYAREAGLEPRRFGRDRHGRGTLARVGRDLASGRASGEVNGTPTLFVDGVVHRGAYDVESLLAALPR